MLSNNGEKEVRDEVVGARFRVGDLEPHQAHDHAHNDRLDHVERSEDGRPRIAKAAVDKDDKLLRPGRVELASLFVEKGGRDDERGRGVGANVPVNALSEGLRVPRREEKRSRIVDAVVEVIIAALFLLLLLL